MTINRKIYKGKSPIAPYMLDELMGRRNFLATASIDDFMDGQRSILTAGTDDFMDGHHEILYGGIDDSMDRRDFLKTAGLFTGAVASGWMTNLFTSRKARAAAKEFHFNVPELEGTTYSNQMVHLYGPDGNHITSDTTIDSKVSMITTSVGDNTPGVIKGYEVLQNYPNPFNGETIIRYTIPKSDNVNVTIFDNRGRVVKQLYDGKRPAGQHTLTWDGRNENGAETASSVYFFRVRAGNFSKTIRMTHIKAPEEMPYDQPNSGPNGSFGNESSHVPAGSLKINGEWYQMDEEPEKTSIRPSVAGNYIALVTDNDPIKRHYDRIVEFAPNDSINNIDDRVVGYVNQPLVTPELFKAFADEANFSPSANGMGYNGLKTMIANPQKRFWVASHHPNDPSATATKEEQEYVKGEIEAINAHLRPENRITNIYLEDPNNHETLPIGEYGANVVVPNPGGFFIGASDNDGDGIIDDSGILLSSGRWNEQWRDSIRQELLSAYSAPSEVFAISKDHQYNFNQKTVLVGAQRNGVPGDPTDYLTPMDIKLLKIGEFYKPKESINNILG